MGALTCRRKNRREEANPYATVSDFCGLFTTGMDELYQLSLVLTADHQRAEQCFVASLEDSVGSKRVFKEWGRSWAKRMIVQNAIAQVKPHPSTASSSTFNIPRTRQLSADEDGHFGLTAVLALPDFERFVFVISVLEHYSDHECSLLLGCSARELRRARTRAVEQIAKSKGTVPVDGNSERVQLVR